MADAVSIKDTDTDEQVRDKIPCFGGVFSAVDDTCRKCAINARCVKLIAKALPGFRAELKASLGRNATPAEVADAAGLETEANLDIVMKHAQGVPLPVLLGLSTTPPSTAMPPPTPAPKKGPPTVPAKAPPPTPALAVPAPPPPKKVPPVAPIAAPQEQAADLRTDKQKAKDGAKAAEKVAKAAAKAVPAPSIPAIDVDPVAKGVGLLDADGNLPDVHDGGTHAMPQKGVKLEPPAVVPDMPAGVEPADAIIEALAKADDEAATATPPAPAVVTPEAPKAAMKKTPTPPKKAPAPKVPAAPAKAKASASKAPPKATPAPVAKKAPAKAAKAKAPKPEKVPTIKPASKAKAPPPKASTPLTGIDARAFARERARSTWVAANLKPGLQITRVYKGDTFALLVFTDHYGVRKNGGKETLYPTATRATEAITGVGSYPRENGSERAYSTHSVPRFWRSQEGAVVKTPPTASVPSAKKVVPVKAAKKPVVKAAKKKARSKPAAKPKAAAKKPTKKAPVKKAAKKPAKKKG